jgi:TonB-dependent receptor
MMGDGTPIGVAGSPENETPTPIDRMNPHDPDRVAPHLRAGSGLLPRFVLSVLFLLCGWLPMAAAPGTAATGSVQGRVLNAANGKYLGRARVTVQGTNLETFTDDFGYYDLNGVPVGQAELRVEYTGQQARTAAVTVTAGKTALEDFTFNGNEAIGAKGGPVKLNTFKVQADRFQNANEIAINEEKNSINIKNVIAADAFGNIPEGNIGEFVKYLPGVLINYGGQSYTNGNDATAIQVRGFSPDLTAITVDGMPITSSQPGSLTRSVNLDMLSINNASRVELTKVPTPDMPADSPGGSINLVSKNAFEYLKPSFDWSVYGSVNSEDTKIFSKEAGPGNKYTYHTLPGVDFSYADPITKNFGITVTGASSNEYNKNRRAQAKYNSSANQTNLSGELNNASNPFLSQLQVTDEPHNSFRQSGSIRADWRVTPGQVLSLTYQLSFYDAVDSARRLLLSPGNASDWGAGFTTGKTNSSQSGGQTITDLDGGGRTQYGQLRWTYDKGPWQIDAAYGHSVSDGSYKSAGNGHFSEVDMDLNNVGQVLFKNIQNGVPGSISVLDKQGNPIDFGNISSYALSGLGNSTFTALAGLSYQKDTINTYKVDVLRDLNFLSSSSLSLSVKAGFYRTEHTTNKWGPGTNFGYQYVGPVSAFDVTQYMDDVYKNISPGYGVIPMQWADPYKVYQFYQKNPQYFSSTSDDTSKGTSVAANNWNSYANQQYDIKETKDAYYAEVLGHFFNNRLGMIAGVREQRGAISGIEPFNVKKWNFLKNPDGSVYTDSVYTTGVDITSAKAFADQALQSRLAAAGITFNHVVNKNSLEAAQLQNVPNHPINNHASGKAAPSANFSYDITKKLQARLGWARTYAAPDFQSGAFGVLERATITDSPGSSPAGSISISNPNLKPWTADNYDLALSYYTNTGGQISADYYLKFVKDFWITNSVILDDTNYVGVLDTVGLVPTTQYLDYQVNTATNGAGTGRTSGFEFNVSQNLSVLGRWGKPFFVFANFSTSKQSANQVSNSGASSNDYGSAGVSFNWKRLSLILKATHQSKTSNQHFTASYIDSTGTKQTLTVYQYQPAVTRLDAEIDYQLSSKLSFFADARNVTNTKLTMQQYDLSGIWPTYARNYDTRDFGVQIAIGIRGTF